MSETTIIYTGDFDGFLTAIYWSFHFSTNQIMNADHFEQNFTNMNKGIYYCEGDLHIASKMAQRIRLRFGEETFEKIYYAYLSGNPASAEYTKRFLDYGSQWLKDHPTNSQQPNKLAYSLIQDYGNDCVFPLLDCARKTARESHRMVGLVRFSEVKPGFFYGCYQSDTNVLPILVLHFIQRLSDQMWVLHDLNREQAGFYNGSEWHIQKLPKSAQLSAHQDEFVLQWQRYYKEIAIESRKSEKRRMQFMPKKYWEYLPELEGLTQVKSR